MGCDTARTWIAISIAVRESKLIAAGDCLIECPNTEHAIVAKTEQINRKEVVRIANSVDGNTGTIGTDASYACSTSLSGYQTPKPQ